MQKIGSLSFLLLPLVSIPGISPYAVAQLPPRDIPRIPPPAPTPQEPLNLPFEIEPQQPLRNDPLPPVIVSNFVFIGNSAFSDNELKSISNPYLGRRINQSQLDELTGKITKKYVENGYVTSGAVYLLGDNTDISPNNAQIVIRVIEGRLDKVEVIGSERLKKYVKNRISSRGALNTDRLLNELRILNNDPLIKRKSLKTSLRPNTEGIINLSNLEINLEPAKAYNLELFINNFRNSGVGTIERGIEFTALNPSTLGDRINVKYANTTGSNVLFADYTIPVSASTSLKLGYVYGSNATIENPFDVLEIQGTSQSYLLGLKHILINDYSDSGSSELSISVDLTRRELQEKILDFDFPVSQGADFDGKTKTNAARFAIDYTKITAVDAALIRAQFRAGFDLYSTTDPLFDNGEFFAVGLDGIYTHKLPLNLIFTARLSGQIADRPLVAGEQFSLGGIYSVRGYKQDAFLGDSGVLGSIGLSIPVHKSKIGTFAITPFFDIGYGSNFFAEQTALLAGAGLALEYQFSDRFAATLSWGYPLFKLDNSGYPSTLQDSGIYFSIKGNLL
jgi:hemolysin activation/secretion protein